MKKAIFSLPLVIPLVTIMPAPAVAHFCCCEALAPTVPSNPPAVPAGAKVNDPCPAVQRAWKDAYCASTDFAVPCSTTGSTQIQLLLQYVVSKDPTTGQLVCSPFGAFKTSGALQPVDVCGFATGFCVHGECRR